MARVLLGPYSHNACFWYKRGCAYQLLLSAMPLLQLPDDTSTVPKGPLLQGLLIWLWLQSCRRRLCHRCPCTGAARASFAEDRAR